MELILKGQTIVKTNIMNIYLPMKTKKKIQKDKERRT